MTITVLIPLASPNLIQWSQVLESASIAFPFSRLVDVKLSEFFSGPGAGGVRFDFRPCYAPNLCVTVTPGMPITEKSAAIIMTGAFSKLSVAMIDKSAENGKNLGA